MPGTPIALEEEVPQGSFRCEDCGEIHPNDACYLIRNLKHSMDQESKVCEGCYQRMIDEGNLTECEECHHTYFEPNTSFYDIQDTRENICQHCYRRLGCKCCDDCESHFSGDHVEFYEGVERNLCNACSDHYRCCENCHERVHEDDAIRENDEVYCCEECMDEANPVDDPGDNEEHHNSDTVTGVIYPGGEEADKRDMVQEPVPSLDTEKVKEFFDRFYDYNYDELTNLGNEGEKIDLAGEFIFETGISYDKSKKLLDMVKSHFVSLNMRTANKYRKYDLSAVSDGKAKFKYIDKLGVEKEREESLMSIQEYLRKMEKKHLGAEKAQVFSSEDFAGAKIQWRISNNVEHKLALAGANASLGSCQNPNHKGGLATGIRDWFNDDAKIPIGFFKGDTCIGRILIRSMYTKEKEHYLLVDRPYLTDILAGKKTELLSKTINELLKLGYNVVVSNVAAHDSPMADYVRDFFRLAPLGKSLRSPKRRMGFRDRAYYNDCGTRAFRDSNMMIYDYINKKKLNIVSLK